MPGDTAALVCACTLTCVLSAALRAKHITETMSPWMLASMGMSTWWPTLCFLNA